MASDGRRSRLSHSSLLSTISGKCFKYKTTIHYMLLKKSIFIIGILILISSCEGGPEEENGNLLLNEFVLFAGESVHDSIVYTEFDPYICVKGFRHGTDSSYYYDDSIKLDLDFDNKNDIQFNYFMEFEQPGCDCEGIDCCMPWGYAYCSIKTMSNIEIACTFYFEHLQPDRLIFGDSIDARIDWHKAEKGIIFSRAGMDNKWNETRYNSFIGYRILKESDTLYGWIRLNTFSADKIEIYDCVIEK